MATISKDWSAKTQIIGSGDSWSTLSGTTPTTSDNVDLETNGYEGAHVTVSLSYDGSPTDEVKVKFVASLSNTLEDEPSPFRQLQGDHDIDPQQLSFIIRDFNHFRVIAQQTGSTDSHDVRAYYKAWRWASS